MRRRRSGTAAFAGLGVVVVVLAFVGWLWWARQPVGGSEKKVRVTIPAGTTVSSVARLLQDQGLIRSALYFSRFMGANHAAIHPGVYDIAATERPTRILRRLSRGDIATVRATFPEGFTDAQIAHRLERLGIILDQNAFLTLVTEHGDTLHASFALPKNLEGYLYPDTYRFPVGATDAQIAQQMVDEFDRLVALGKASDIAASKRPLSNIVNVAAMVEREAEIDADRPKIASVIYNRIGKGMKLEIDATVEYARGAHTSRLLYKDLAVDSPYNTYKFAGLPAGPICNPGLPSIDAALHPAQTTYLYYVASGHDGKAHAFASTEAEHERNVAAYRHSAAAARNAARAAGQTPAAAKP